MFGKFKEGILRMKSKEERNIEQARRDFLLLKKQFGDNVELELDNTLISIKMRYQFKGQIFNRIFIEYKDGKVSFIDGRRHLMCSSDERLKVEEILTLKSK